LARVGSGGASTNPRAGWFTIGWSGDGELIVSNGGDVISGETTIGNVPQLVTGGFDPYDARASVSGAGSTWTTDWLNVGTAGGDGQLRIENGGVVSSDGASVGGGYVSNGVERRDSTGLVIINGAGSAWNIEGDLSIGDFGEGVLVLSNGGALSAGAVELGGNGGAGRLVIGAEQGQGAAGAGALNTDSIALLGEGAVVFNHTAGGLIVGAPISGDGSILQLAGVTILDGDNGAFDGATEVNGGTLIVNQALGGDIFVGADGVLSGAGVLGDLEVSGRLEIGEPIGDLMAGSVVFLSGSIFAVDLAANGASDLLDVSGAASILGGEVEITALDPDTAYTDGSLYTILEAGGGVTGAFQGILENSAFLDFELAQHANSVDVVVSVVAQFPDVAATDNQLGASMGLAALDQTPGSDALSVYNTLLLLDESSARDAFDASSGEIHASVQHAVTSASGFFTDTLLRRPADGRRGWMAPLGQFGDVDSDGNAAALDYSTIGLAGGVEQVFDTANGEFTGGVALGFSRTEADIDDRASQAETSAWHIGAYGSWTRDAFEVAGALSYGSASIDTDRDIAFSSINRSASASYDASVLGASLEASYAVEMAGGWTLAPVATLGITRGKFDSGSETGAGALDLEIGGETFERIDLGVGAEGRFALESGEVRARVLYEHAMGDLTAERNLALSGSPADFVTFGPETDRGRIRLGVGFETPLNDDVSVSARYDGALSDSDSEHAARVAVSLRF
jgi:outer membrane autotransporter protein